MIEGKVRDNRDKNMWDLAEMYSMLCYRMRAGSRREGKEGCYVRFVVGVVCVVCALCALCGVVCVVQTFIHEG